MIEKGFLVNLGGDFDVIYTEYRCYNNHIGCFMLLIRFKNEDSSLESFLLTADEQVGVTVTMHKKWF